MVKSKFRHQSEIFMIVAFQVFLLGGSIIKLFSTNGEFSYLLVTTFVLLVMFFSFLLISNLFKSVEIDINRIVVKRLFLPKLIFNKEEIEGYYNYKTIGALGEEESVYIHLRSGKKVGIHSKAYKNFSSIKKAIKNFGLINLGDYDYENSYLKYFKVALPLAFLFSILLFLLSKII